MKVITFILQMRTLRLKGIHSFFPQTFIKNDMMGRQGSPCKAYLAMITNGDHAFLKWFRNIELTKTKQRERKREEECRVLSCSELTEGFQNPLHPGPLWFLNF